MRFLQRLCDKNPTFYLKTRIGPKSYVANISPIITNSKSAREIISNEIAVPVSVAGILNRNIELFLALEAPIK